jgi:hypothetical protein
MLVATLSWRLRPLGHLAFDVDRSEVYMSTRFGLQTDVDPRARSRRYYVQKNEVRTTPPFKAPCRKCIQMSL